MIGAEDVIYFDRSCDRYGMMGSTCSILGSAFIGGMEQIDFTSSLILGDRTIWQEKRDLSF